MIVMDNIIRSVFRSSNDKLNIVTMCKNDEKYISLLSRTNHNFYLLPNHKWNSLIEDKPKNVHILTSCDRPIDFLICYNRAEQYEEAQIIARKMHVPIILVDMCGKELIRPQNLLEYINAKNPALLNKQPCLQIVCTDSIRESWNKDCASITIPIGIDIEKYQDSQKDHELFVCIDNNTHSNVGARLSSHIPKEYTTIPTDHDQRHQVNNINKSRYFINTYKSITVKVLEAMAAGTIVLCLKNTDTESFINHNEDGMLFKSLTDLTEQLQYLDQQPNKRAKIIQAARARIVREHCLDSFISKWHTAFKNLESVFYTPDM